jgi:type II secretion system protein I
MKPAIITRQDGITILEVLIAMIILSMSLLLLLNMAMVALDGNDWSNKTTVANQLMQEKLEQLRSQTGSGLSSGSDSVDGVARHWAVSNVGSHMRRVDVKVVWTDIRSTTHTSTMSTIIRTDSL